ncbi:MAG TPA: M64 family metallopeptidase [Myxococcales bacterium]|nr:M64 family metallopeptidase [Myxococcales bacterium]
MSTLLLALLLAAPRTFRVDYFHTGSASEEHFALDRLALEPLPFPGNPDRPIDDLNLGKYFFEVQSADTHRVLYSRGFSSIFGEYEETEAAKTLLQTYSESFRFPAPSSAVDIVLKKRNPKNEFAPIWTLRVDPADMNVDSSMPPSPGPLLKLVNNGPSEKKVDLLILGDGYTAKERGKFEKDAHRLVQILFQQEPFKSHQKDFNIWGLCPPAEESGISRPSLGIHHRSRVGATYDAFGSERYILTFENRSFRDVASFAPYELVEILTNSDTYGGGGIFNTFSTVASNSLWSPYVFVHEFGHHMAALADEYYTSDTAYLPPKDKLEPWEPNVTALADAKKIKWQDLLTPGTAIPTPWAKEAFEQQSLATQEKRRQIRKERRPESDMDALFTAERENEEKLLGSDVNARKVGAFEGGNYAPKGVYRSQEDCIMFTRDRVPFCAVCQSAISRVIDLYTSGPRR